MFEKRPKLSFFILGMFFGALCGGILVYYNSVITNENKISVNLIPQIVKQVIGVINNKTEISNDSTLLSNETSSDKEIASLPNPESEDFNEAMQTEKNELNKDSVYIDSLAGVTSEESITLKKEELLISKEFTVYPLEAVNTSKQNKADSLLAVVSGTKDESKKGNQQKILVELWKSPINYRGYQAAKNKIIFFGIAEIDVLKLYSYKNNLLLKYNETVYSIEYDSEFKAYEKVVDANLLSQINKINP